MTHHSWSPLSKATKPACSKSRSYASASVMPRSSMTRKLAQSVRLHLWSLRERYLFHGGPEQLISLRDDFNVGIGL